MEIIGFLGIFLALGLFLVLVYRGWASYWVAPICALIVAATNRLNFTESITKNYVGGLANLFISLFSVLLLGAMLGKVFADTGAASSIVKTLNKYLVDKKKGDAKIRFALLSVMIISIICTMGGIGAYILTFTMFPVCLVMAEMADIPRRFIPGMLCLNGAFLAAPGAPQINNIIAKSSLEAMGYNVSAGAGLIPGIIGTVVITVGAYITLSHMILKAKKKGEHFEYGPLKPVIEDADRKLPNFFVALLPLITVFVCFMIFDVDIFISLLVGVLINLIFMGRNLPLKDNRGLPVTIGKSVVNTLNTGALQFPNALFTVITPAGLAAVIMATPSFKIVVDKLYTININYIILTILVVCVVVSLTSSPAAALLVALPLVVNTITIQGGVVNADAVVRIGAMAAMTFLTFPHNGFVVLGINLAQSTHKESYKAQFYMSFMWTFIGTIVAAGLMFLFPALA